MCGRYSLAPGAKKKLEDHDKIGQPIDWKVSYNIAPTHLAPILTKSGSKFSINLMHWGLVPSWQKEGKTNGSLINARLETIMEKPSFFSAWQERRCLIPADSFYEWRKEPGSQKTPYRIKLKSEELLFMAGLWEKWTDGKTALHTFTILTVSPNQEMANLHNRMPLILKTEYAQDAWLGGELHPPMPENDILTMTRVSDKVNTPHYDGPDLHESLPDIYRLF